MIPASIDDLVQAAADYHRAGQFAEAETTYRQALAQAPNHPQALHFFGLLAAQLGQSGVAVALIERSTLVDPTHAGAWTDLGHALQASGRLEEAIAAHRRALHLDPAPATAWNHLGLALEACGRFDGAIAAYREALQREPAYPAACTNLGGALAATGRLEEAIATHTEAARLAPLDARFSFNLGNALVGAGKLDEAGAAYREALRLDPHHAKAWNNLGAAFLRRGQFESAIECYRETVRLAPGEALALSNLGSALQAAARTDEAAETCRRALELDPRCTAALNNLGESLSSQGQVEAALDCFRKAMALQPAVAEFHSSYLCCLNFQPDHNASSVLTHAREWDRRHAQSIEQIHRPHANDPTADRRLRVGYVSADFRRHVVGYNLLPLLREHDREQFEIFCFSNTRTADTVTEQIRMLSDGWREIAHLDDEQAANLVRADGIDLLVDLSMHTSGNRLLVFARKPAPVQLTYLGYCSTTGLSTMDYRLSDWFIDPPETDLRCYTEKTVRLSGAYWRYEPAGLMPEISPLPALTTGRVTFSCRNSFTKVSIPTQECWIRLLHEVPDARLLLAAPEGLSRVATRRRFTDGGIAEERLEFVGHQSWSQFTQSYAQVDIALDPFPYCGWITTCDALWMGVPVISLRGATAVGRGGSSILNHVGLAEFVAETPEEYVKIAATLAGDLPKLGELRSSLRDRMERSPLRDGARVAREIEAAYRQMWRQWCLERPK